MRGKNGVICAVEAVERRVLSSGFLITSTFDLSPGDGSTSFFSEPAFLAAVDLNHDGKTDLVAAEKYGVINVYLGGALATPKQIITNGIYVTATSLLVADVTGDGIPDIVLGYTYQRDQSGPIVSNVVVWVGNGDGTFSRGRLLNASDSAGFPSGAPMFLATAQINGHPDLIISDFKSDTILYGDGAGHFSAGAGEQLAGSPGILAEGNFDGRPGLVVMGPGSGVISLISSNSDETFTPSRVIVSGLFDNGVNSAYGGSDLSVADFNGDGKADLLITNYGTSEAGLAVLLGNGDGTFKAPIAKTPQNSYTSSFIVADTSGSGNSDVVASTTFDSTIIILPGNGDGTFTTSEIATIANPNRYYSPSFAVGDFNGDGHPDLVATLHSNGNSRSAKVYALAVAYGGASSASGSVDIAGGSNSAVDFFGNGRPGQPGSFPTAIATGDLNGDGNTDVVTTNVYGNSLMVLLGDGTGGFEPSQFLPTGNDPAAVAIADVNHDGIPDLIVANSRNYSIDVYLGNGDGTFKAPEVIPQKGVAFSVLVADFNHDGNPDILVDGANGLQILAGNGDGTFKAGVTVSGVSPEYMSLADFNGDGNLDVLCVESGGMEVLLGNGDGTFKTMAVGPSFPPQENAIGVISAVAADFSGDGHPDIVYRTANQIDELPGNGDGTFGAARLVLRLPSAYASGRGLFLNDLAVADVNGDGRPDLIYADTLTPGAIAPAGVPYGTVALIGNGDGTFKAPSAVQFSSPAYGPVIAAAKLTTGGNNVVFETQTNGTVRAIVNTFTTVTHAPSLIVPDLTFAEGTAGSFQIEAGGYPTPTVTETGGLPPGITFVDNGDGTATLSGTPAANSSGDYDLTITATNGIAPEAQGAYPITVIGAVAISSAGSATFVNGSSGSFTVDAAGFPLPAVSVAGALPAGVSFSDNGNGTATLSVAANAAPGRYVLAFTAANGATATVSQTFTLTVDQSPAIGSSSMATFTVGTAGSFTISTSGFPVATLGESGMLPAGLTFTDNHDGTATISGTPAVGTLGVYHPGITATNGVGPEAIQNITLAVAEAPAFTSSSGAVFAPGVTGQFTITTTGAPTAALTEAGPLPAGLSFHDNGDGTATISGAPIFGSQGTYPLTLEARNSGGTVTQSFALIVGAAGSTPPIIALLGHTLNGVGTSTNDVASVSLVGSNLVVTIDSVTKSFPASAVTSIYMTMNAGDDSLTIGPGVGAVLASGGDGDDTIIANNSGADTVNGNGGNDSLVGGAGMDFLRGGAGNDTLVAGSGFNSLHGNTGDDSLVGGAGHAQLNGGPGSNVILVGQNDTLVSGGGVDSILRGL